MSTKLSSALLNDIQTNYGFKSVQVGRDLGGLSASNYIIEADGELLVLKKYRSAAEDVAARIEAITTFLYRHGVPVAMPFRTRADNYHFAHNSALFAVYPKINGQVLHEPSLSPEALQSAATALAQFHIGGQGCKLHLPKTTERIVPKTEVTTKAKVLRQRVKVQSLGGEIDELTEKLLVTKLALLAKLLPPEEIARYFSGHDLVHGDFYNENLLFNTNGEVVCLLDFEEVHFGHRVEDVLNFIHLACCNSGYKKENMDKARNFLKAYTSISSLSRQDILYGTHFSLYRFVTSFFLENELYAKQELFLAQFLQRDLEKFTFFLTHLEEFVRGLSE